MRRSASGDGLSPLASSPARMNGSIAPRGQAVFFTVGAPVGVAVKTTTTQNRRRTADLQQTQAPMTPQGARDHQSAQGRLSEQPAGHGSWSCLRLASNRAAIIADAVATKGADSDSINIVEPIQS